MPRLSDLVTIPVSAARVFSGAKSFALPVIGSERLNRRGLHVWRTKAAYRMAETRRRRLAHLASVTDRDDFARDGFVLKRDFLAADTFRALTEQVMALSAPGGKCARVTQSQGASRSRRRS